MKRKKAHFGYKGHLAVDQGSGLVRQAEMTSVNVHDSRLGEALVQGDEQAVFADRAYDSQAFRESLRRRGIGDGIIWKSGVERANATMKQWYRLSRVRYRGLARNACHLRFVATAMNMKRALVLMDQA